MKRLLSRFLPGRCSRAHLLFVGLLLAVYLATLVFFHVELDVADPLQRAAADAPWHEDISFKNPPPGYMPARSIVDRRQRARNASTQSPTTPHRLEQCPDVHKLLNPLQQVNDSARTDDRRLFSSRQRRINISRHSINLSAPTLPWCSNQRDSITSPPKILYAEGSLNDSSSSFQTLVAGQHYVYSAYYDDRLEASSAGGGVVRVIAVLRTAGGTATAPTPTLFCHVDITSDDWSLASVLMLMMWRSSRYHTAALQYYEMCENHGKDYGGWILTCALPRSLRRPPCHIFVSSSVTFDASNAVSLPVYRTRPAAGLHAAPVRFGVCVPPLFGRVKPRTLIEFIEMTRLLGAEHFVFYAPSHYVTSASDDDDNDDPVLQSPTSQSGTLLHSEPVNVDVGDVLRLYSAAKLATVIPWTLPQVTTASSSGIWYGGQLPAINDCLYRSVFSWMIVCGQPGQVNHLGTDQRSLFLSLCDKQIKSMHAFDRVVFNDVDEFVVAHWPLKDWTEMSARFDQYFQSTTTVRPSPRSATSPPVAKLTSGVRQRRYCAFSFRSAFFDPMTPPSVAYVGASGKLMTSSLSSVAYELESDIRTEIFSAVRTKVMVDPRRVFELGIHHVSRSAGDAECPVLHVDPRDAFVRHYRQCVRDFDAQMDCSRQCLDDELATSRRIAVVRRRTRRVIDTLLHRS